MNTKPIHVALVAVGGVARAILQPAVIALGLMTVGGVMLVGGVRLLVGEGWALVAAGMYCITAAAIILRGLAR